MSSAPPGRCSTGPCTPTPRACSRRFRPSTVPRSRSRASPATRPTWPGCRPAAGSIPAARTRLTSARRSRRSWPRSMTRWCAACAARTAACRSRLASRRRPRGGPDPMTSTELLRADHLTRHFKIGGALSRRALHAVDDVNFTIGEREIVALAGESGSGKSTIARVLARISKPTSGEIYFEGKPVSRIRSRAGRLRYSGLVPMVFQDPFGSMNPVLRVQHGVLRSLKLHRPSLSAQERSAEAARVFETVGLGADMLERFPYELSGGQRQRVGFAQALAMRPKLILADEPVSMLDVSIRIGLLNLMTQLRDEQGVSILYITHDIASARYVADRLIVMYAGQIAEQGTVEDVLADPRHPYTQLLLSAVPDPRAPLSVGAETDRGEPPKIIDPTPGCRFRWRCPIAIDACHSITPQLLPIADGHEAACHVAQSGAEVRAFSR